MTKRDWFDVGVRLIGVWQIIVALNDFVAYGDVVLKISTQYATGSHAYLTHGFAYLLIGFALAVSGGFVTNIAYGAPRDADQSAE